MFADLNWQSPAGRGRRHLRPGGIVRNDTSLRGISGILPARPNTDGLDKVSVPAFAEKHPLDRAHLFQGLGGGVEDDVGRARPMAAKPDTVQPASFQENSVALPARGAPTHFFSEFKPLLGDLLPEEPLVGSLPIFAPKMLGKHRRRVPHQMCEGRARAREAPAEAFLQG